MDTIIMWNGAGWYAPMQVGAHESERVEFYPISGFSPDGWNVDYDESVWQAANGMHLGTPAWFDHPEEVQGEYTCDLCGMSEQECKCWEVPPICYACGNTGETCSCGY